jgi:hypothetical protein
MAGVFLLVTSRSTKPGIVASHTSAEVCDVTMLI